MRLICTGLACIAVSAGSAVADPVPGPEERVQAADDAVLAYVEEHFYDPQSALRKMTRGPRAGSIKEPFAAARTGDIVCYSLNGKNRYGGYVGARRYVFVVAAGKVIYSNDETNSRFIVADECALPAD